MKLVVGAPIRDRAWILPLWFEHTLAAVEHAVHVSEVEFVFVGSISDPSMACATDQANKCGVPMHWVDPATDDHGPYERAWTMARYEMMAQLRNELLQSVRYLQPDLFWSLDTDILVAENTLSSAMQSLDRFDAVGTKLYMTPQGRYAPSYGMLPGTGGLRRSDAEGTFPVDVIMASKLMSPKAYAVDYEPHSQGEDIGWSRSARKSGCRLGWDGSTCSKHVMSPEALHICDPRCGF